MIVGRCTTQKKARGGPGGMGRGLGFDREGGDGRGGERQKKYQNRLPPLLFSSNTCTMV